MAEDEKKTDAASIADAVSKALIAYEPHAKSVGKFIADITGHPLKEGFGLFGDIFGYARLELLAALKPRYDRIVKDRGIHPKAIPLSLAHPLLEAASTEDDEDMAEMFAHLLVSYASDSHTKFTPKSFVETLKRMSPYEAMLLKRLAECADGDDEGRWMATVGLPNLVIYSSPSPTDLNRTRPESNPNRLPEGHVKLALSSLNQLGCVEFTSTFAGVPSYETCRVTFYGLQLIKACT